MNDDEARIEAELRKSRNYARVCDAVLQRVAEWAARREAPFKEQVKSAKRKLHQVCGAFLRNNEFKYLGKALADRIAGITSDKEFVATVIGLHTSTSERAPVYPEFWDRVFERAGIPHSIVDIGCGLNPFTLPWQRLPVELEYHALDLDTGLAELINTWFGLHERVRLAIACDVLYPPPVTAEIALLMKLLPTLEQQEKGSGARILRGLDCGMAVVTFPLATLSGRDVRMEDHYRRYMENLLSDLALHSERLALGSELVYFIELGRGPQAGRTRNV